MGSDVEGGIFCLLRWVFFWVGFRKGNLQESDIQKIIGGSGTVLKPLLDGSFNLLDTALVTGQVIEIA